MLCVTSSTGNGNERQFPACVHVALYHRIMGTAITEWQSQSPEEHFHPYNTDFPNAFLRLSLRNAVILVMYAFVHFLLLSLRLCILWRRELYFSRQFGSWKSESSGPLCLASEGLLLPPWLYCSIENRKGEYHVQMVPRRGKQSFKNEKAFLKKSTDSPY